jgi:hypothetical protein
MKEIKKKIRAFVVAFKYVDAVYWHSTNIVIERDGNLEELIKKQLDKLNADEYINQDSITVIKTFLPE